jgi:hypothetical protein
MTPSRRTSLFLLLAAPVLARLAPASIGAPPPPFRVIVNSGNQAVAVDRKFLTEAFLKRTTRWPGGELIRPVDLSGASPVRRRFSEDILNRSVAAVKSYWQQLIFSGRAIPPPELDRDEEIIRYVARYSGAVGYVSGVGEVTGVKVVIVK